MRFVFSLQLILFFQFTCFSQGYSLDWENTIGSTNSEKLQSVFQTSDNGYILGGYSESNSAVDKSEDSRGGADYWIVKTDEFGIIEWDKTIGGANHDLLRAVVQTSDGGYLVGGESYSNISGEKTEDNLGSSGDYWVLKLNSTGDIIWQNTIGGSTGEILTTIEEANGGGYILGGYSGSDISGDKTENSIEGTTDFWIVKLNELGEVSWDKTIGGSSTDNMWSMDQTPDGGYVIGGSSSSGISGNKTEPSIGGFDYWIVKLDFAGNIEWDKTIGGENNDYLTSIELTSDEGYIISGTSESGFSGDKTESHVGMLEMPDYWILKLNTVGDIEWQNTIGGDYTDECSIISELEGGGYIVGGTSESILSGDRTVPRKGISDYWIVKLDADGAIIWDGAYGGYGQETFESIYETFDGGFVLAGDSQSGASIDKTEDPIGLDDYWIVKLSPCPIIDNSVSVEGMSLSAVADGYAYQWVNCDDDNAPIDTATDQTFSPSEDGNYAVIISDGDCEVISGCNSISSSSIKEFETYGQLSIYPNPTNNKVIIDYQEPLKIEILDAVGKVVLTSNTNEISIKHLSRGGYIISVYNNEDQLINVSRIIKD